ncbi:SH3 domain-containing protein [Acidocella aminolytica]|uniref:SH3 domain-containing protein n=1 Tax=Acidocella aminolytica TaxID=33998 RepID=UPI0006626AE3|nr:SH3 domain-containing protein [Acidocella aminolytica]
MVADHDRSYEAPIFGTVGDVVKIVRREDDEPGWMWCEHSASGLAGWVPEAFLEREDEHSAATLRRNYSAMELTVVVGQSLMMFETVAGWTWCASAEGDAGWVPNHKLATS